MDSDSEDSVLDLKFSDVVPDLSDLLSAPGSRLRPKFRSRPI